MAKEKSEERVTTEIREPRKVEVTPINQDDPNKTCGKPVPVEDGA